MTLPAPESVSKRLTEIAEAARSKIIYETTEQILVRWFQTTNPRLVESRQNTSSRLAEALSDVKALSRPDTWFNRHFPSKNQKKADQAVAQAKVAAEQSQREYLQAFEPYAEAHWHEADALRNDSETKKEILLEANRLLEKVLHMLDLLETAKADCGPQILDHTFGQLPQSALSGKGELAFIAARVHELELFTNSELPIRVANAKICEGATEIHDALLALNDGELWAESDGLPFLQATTNGLVRNMLDEVVPSSAAPQQRLLDTFRSAIFVDKFRRPEAWLTFWTGVHATHVCYRKAYGASSSEDGFSGDWCSAWEEQVKAWGPQLCEALGMPRNSVHVLRGTLLDSGAETGTGADVLIALCTSVDNTVRVRLAFIQFKRDSAQTDKLSVWSNGSRQFETLQKVHMPHLGSSSMHGLISVVNHGFAAVPAVDVQMSAVAVNDAKGLPAGSAASMWIDAKGCRVDWRVHGESLPTLLTRALCEDASGAFDSIKDAFTWLSNESGLDAKELPKYMLFQALGGDAYSYAHAMKNEMLEWSKVLGVDFDEPSVGDTHDFSL